MGVRTERIFESRRLIRSATQCYNNANNLTCLDSSSLHNVYNVINFLERVLASKNPSATSMISQIKRRSGTTIAHGLNNAFKFSGSSALPAYPGFIVINTPTVFVNGISSPIKSNNFLSSLIASWMLLT